MFSGCSGLTRITIPASVTDLESRYCSDENCFEAWPFSDCGRLTNVFFLGNAPALISAYPLFAFRGAAPEFTFYHLSGKTGFSAPEWLGTPAVVINEATWPAASWLLAHDFWYDTNLRQDPNSDGVSLLIAYALDLDPRLNLQDSLPVAELGADSLSLSFHATSPGLTYLAETSTDLKHWTTSGVTQTAPGPDHRSTARVIRDAPLRFLRLRVED